MVYVLGGIISTTAPHFCRCSGLELAAKPSAKGPMPLGRSNCSTESSLNPIFGDNAYFDCNFACVQSAPFTITHIMHSSAATTTYSQPTTFFQSRSKTEFLLAQEEKAPNGAGHATIPHQLLWRHQTNATSCAAWVVATGWTWNWTSQCWKGKFLAWLKNSKALLLNSIVKNWHILFPCGIS